MMMKSRRFIRVLVLAGVAVGLAAARIDAATISVNPASPTVALGAATTADIIVSGLTEPVGAFTFTLSFNNGILNGTGFSTAGAATMGPGFEVAPGSGFGGGGTSPFTLEVLADFNASWTSALAAAGQGASFTLATVNFNAIGVGGSSLTLGGPGGVPELSNFDGTDLIALDVLNGSVEVFCTQCNPTVPEPGLLALLTAGAAIFGVRRRTGSRG